MTELHLELVLAKAEREMHRLGLNHDEMMDYETTAFKLNQLVGIVGRMEYCQTLWRLINTFTDRKGK